MIRLDFDLTDLSGWESVVIGFAVYLVGFAVNWVMEFSLGWSIPFFSLLLAVAVYFVLIRPNDGSLLWYAVGYFAILLLAIVLLVVLVGGLVFLSFI
ncbi:MAG: hypothetical protein NWF06_10390 [Candidatus Bathyarchaeota archaeon]|nr:hypothetical protein [Candidatus Bathyarchaeum sp.]